MKNAVLQAIADRRSHRSYLPQQLTNEQLDAIVEAALQSPSGRNLQPWHFTVVQDQALLNRISAEARAVDATQPKEEQSARFADPAFQIFYNAPTVIFVWVNHVSHYAPIDCGIAVQSMALAAQSLGLGSVIVGLTYRAFEGDQKDALMQQLQAPPGSAFAISIALGTPNDTKPAHGINRDKVTFLR
ncbi:MAG: nitroreductase family protein [Clostridiales bacterium]|nr:nitroreductase family protein [Clostridiales bacterium]